jgi:hypothetical protein
MYGNWFLFCCIKSRCESHPVSYPWILVDHSSVGIVIRAWNWPTTLFSWMLRLRMHQAIHPLPYLSSWQWKVDNLSLVNSQFHDLATSWLWQFILKSRTFVEKCFYTNECRHMGSIHKRINAVY